MQTGFLPSFKLGASSKNFDFGEQFLASLRQAKSPTNTSAANAAPEQMASPASSDSTKILTSGTKLYFGKAGEDKARDIACKAWQPGEAERSIFKNFPYYSLEDFLTKNTEEGRKEILGVYGNIILIAPAEEAASAEAKSKLLDDVVKILEYGQRQSEQPDYGRLGCRKLDDDREISKGRKLIEGAFKSHYPLVIDASRKTLLENFKRAEMFPGDAGMQSNFDLIQINPYMAHIIGTDEFFSYIDSQKEQGNLALMEGNYEAAKYYDSLIWTRALSEGRISAPWICCFHELSHLAAYNEARDDFLNSASESEKIKFPYGHLGDKLGSIPDLEYRAVLDEIQIATEKNFPHRSKYNDIRRSYDYSVMVDDPILEILKTGNTPKKIAVSM